MSNIYTSVPIPFFLLILSSFLFSSNTETYQVTGTLVDENESVVAGHRILLLNANDEQIDSDQTDIEGRFSLSYEVEPTSAEPGSDPDSPMEFKLGSSYPNPFNPRTVIPFQAPKRTNAVIAVYNILGQEVMRTRSELGKGSHEIEVNLGAGLSQGTYLLRVQGDGYSLTRAMTFVSAGISSGRAGIRISSGGQVQRSISGNTHAAAEPGMYRLVVEGTEVYQQKEVMIPSHDDFEDFEYEAGFIMVFFREPVEMMDSDGNVYQTVKIGDQWWMAENLKVTRYRNGDPIPNVKNGAEWESLVTGAYSTYNNLDPYAETYGYLYNWHVLNDVRNIAPEGWRVPSDQDWQDLVDHLGGEEVAGGKMKEEGTTHWTSPNTGATNESGFTVLPGGYRALGPFYFIGDLAGFWTATEDNTDEAWYQALAYNTATIGRISISKRGGLSLRLIRDTSPEPSMTGIEISPQEESVESGESMQFAAMAHYSDLSEKDATGASNWFVSPSEAGAVDGNGLFTASLSFTGTATVMASYNEVSDQADLTITPATITDINGNLYHTIVIGEQQWMAENLRVTSYRDGSAISTGLSDAQWKNTTSGAYAVYPHEDISGLNSEVEVAQALGNLYNWHAVDDSRGLCPEGWVVPSDADWNILLYHVMSKGYPNEFDDPDGAGNALKSRRQVNSPLGEPWATSQHPRWDSDDTHYGKDAFGFSGLPGGIRLDYGTFRHVGRYGYWWSSSENGTSLNAWSWILSSGSGRVTTISYGKRMGFPVRCLRD